MAKWQSGCYLGGVFMGIIIEQPNENIDLADIEKIEVALGKRLSADYRQFLVAFNGGRPENNQFAIPHENNTICFSTKDVN